MGTFSSTTLVAYAAYEQLMPILGDFRLRAVFPAVTSLVAIFLKQLGELFRGFFCQRAENPTFFA